MRRVLNGCPHLRHVPSDDEVKALLGAERPSTFPTSLLFCLLSGMRVPGEASDCSGKTSFRKGNLGPLRPSPDPMRSEAERRRRPIGFHTRWHSVLEGMLISLPGRRAKPLS